MASLKKSALFLAAACAVGIPLGTISAKAQDYDRYSNEPAYDLSAPPETVEVYAPRHRHFPQSGELGAPVVHASFSQEVRFDDLDLRTPWGARALRSRIRYVAQELCRDMDVRYPIATSDSPPCYRDAYAKALYQADAAIAEARGYAYRD